MRTRQKLVNEPNSEFQTNWDSNPFPQLFCGVGLAHLVLLWCGKSNAETPTT